MQLSFTLAPEPRSQMMAANALVKTRGAATILVRHQPKSRSKSSAMVPGDGTPPRQAKAINRLNDLSAKEWIPETVSVWVQRGLGKGHEHAQIEKLHPAPFSFQDIARLVRFFTKAGEAVLDPFAGVGSALKAAALEGRRGIGIELNPKYAALAQKRLALEIPDDALACRDQQIIRGDARSEIPKLAKDSIKLVVTSPPYWSILHKKDHKA
ncbi:MAG: DNA methyltransferase, partial [Gammaproteobacteria bacterium]